MPYSQNRHQFFHVNTVSNAVDMAAATLSSRSMNSGIANIPIAQRIGTKRRATPLDAPITVKPTGKTSHYSEYSPTPLEPSEHVPDARRLFAHGFQSHIAQTGVKWPK